MKYRSLFLYTAGAILEWYDFSLLGIFAPIIASNFFPNTQDKLVSLLLTFSVFASGFIMRPIGAILFGHIGDRYGRKRALVISFLLMSIATVIIGILPGYNKIGVYSPIFLTFVRVAQGISVGGEYSGAITTLGEIAHNKKRGLISSFAIVGSVTGMLLGSIIGAILFAFLPNSIVHDWAWRVPFIAGAFLGYVGLRARVQATESVFYKDILQRKNIITYPISTVLKEYKSRVMITCGLFVVTVVGYYLTFVYLPNYFVTLGKITMQNALLINSICMFCAIILIPVFGYLSDIFGGKYIMWIGIISLILLSYPLFYLISHAKLSYVFFAQLCFSILMAIFIAPAPSMSINLFPTNIRYTAVGLGANLTISLLGGTTPLIATFLVYLTHSIYAPYGFLCVTMLIGMICVFFAAKYQYVAVK